MIQTSMNRTIHDLISELARRSPTIAAMNLAATLPDIALENGLFNVANVSADLDRVSQSIDALVTRAGMANADVEKAVRDLLSQRNFYGTYLELGAYEWLDRHGIRFRAQQPLAGQDVLNPNGEVCPPRCLRRLRRAARRSWLGPQYAFTSLPGQTGR
jgi:hypothetical protein